jgi:hypothetical protein
LDELTTSSKAVTYPCQTSMSLVGFESTILAFERAKTVHALGRAATVMGNESIAGSKMKPKY